MTVHTLSVRQFQKFCKKSHANGPIVVKFKNLTCSKKSLDIKKIVAALEHKECPRNLDLQLYIIDMQCIAVLSNMLQSGNYPAGLRLRFSLAGGWIVGECIEKLNAMLQNVNGEDVTFILRLKFIAPQGIEVLLRALESESFPRNLMLSLQMGASSALNEPENFIEILRRVLASGNCPSGLKLIFLGKHFNADQTEVLNTALVGGRYPNAALISDKGGNTTIKIQPFVASLQQLALTSTMKQLKKGSLTLSGNVCYVLKEDGKPTNLAIDRKSPLLSKPLKESCPFLEAGLRLFSQKRSELRSQTTSENNSGSTKGWRQVFGCCF